LSSDDSIEIELPSLKQSAPQLVERVESKRAPGPIEAQLSGSAADDDLSWLTAIFADDEDNDSADDDADADPAYQGEVAVEVDHETDADAGSADPVDSGAPGTPADAWPDLATTEPPISLESLLDATPADLSERAANGAAEGSEGGFNGVNDLLLPLVRPSLEEETYDDTPGEIDAPSDLDPAPGSADGDALSTGTDQPDAPSRSEKATGFREEIMSTFSQMYN